MTKAGEGLTRKQWMRGEVHGLLPTLSQVTVDAAGSSAWQDATGGSQDPPRGQHSQPRGKDARCQGQATTQDSRFPAPPLLCHLQGQPGGGCPEERTAGRTHGALWPVGREGRDPGAWGGEKRSPRPTCGNQRRGTEVPRGHAVGPILGHTHRQPLRLPQGHCPPRPPHKTPEPQQSQQVYCRWQVSGRERGASGVVARSEGC